MKEFETTNNLPAGWINTTIAAISNSIQYGYTASACNDNVGPKFLRITDIQDNSVEWEDVPCCAMNNKDDLNKYLLRPGDIVFARTGATVGKSYLIQDNLPSEAIFASYLIRINLAPFINPKFVYDFFQSRFYWEQIKKSSSGIGQPNVNGKKLGQIILSLPPLSEQHRIVARIEELFSRLDAGMDALRRAKAQLQRYRQSVLQAAVTGRLTADWRAAHPEVETAEKLLERTKYVSRSKIRDKYKITEFNGALQSSGLDDSWALTTIGRVAECLDYMRVPINKKERAKRVGNIPYYGANGQVGWIDDFLFDEPLVLVVEDETFTGREKPFSYKIIGRSWVNNHAHVLRATIAVDVDYLNYSLQYYPFTPLTTGTTGRKKLTQQALISAKYALPPLMEQKEIVKSIESHFSSSDQVERTIETSLKYSNPLRKSILKRAFQGKLVPQDPSDEPASLLFERIRAERTKASQSRGRGRSPKTNQVSLIQ